MRLDRLEAAGRAGRLLQRGDRGRVLVGGEDAGAFGQAQRKRADAAEQVGDDFRAADVFIDKSGERGLAGQRRLQERAGRQRHPGASYRNGRSGALGNQFAVAGEARDTMGFGDPREARRPRRGERA